MLDCNIGPYSYHLTVSRILVTLAPCQNQLKPVQENADMTTNIFYVLFQQICLDIWISKTWPSVYQRKTNQTSFGSIYSHFLLRFGRDIKTERNFSN
jgi:hypothetical protein